VPERDDGARLPPPVTVTGGPASTSTPLEPAGSRSGLVLALLATALLVAVAVVSRPHTSPPPAPPPPDVALRLADRPIVGSQSGVLLLPVDVVVRGPGVRIDRSLLWAEPVRQEAVLTGRTRFDADSTGRLLVLVQPDCRLMSPWHGYRLRVTVELELVGPEQQRATAVLDLGAEPPVARRAEALCRPPG
jgi:hypothetical protein